MELLGVVKRNIVPYFDFTNRQQCQDQIANKQELIVNE